VHSKIAPDEFLHNELKRRFNYEVYNTSREILDISDTIFQFLKESIEMEFGCYYNHETFIQTQFFDSNHRHLLAGYNNQIERFLGEHSKEFEGAFHQMGWEYDSSRITRFKKAEPFRFDSISEIAARHLIATGCLYPLDNKNVIRHPNFVMGHCHRFGFYDSPFLNRDYIRAAYFHADADFDGIYLEPIKTWEFWQDLACLSAALPVSRGYYKRDFEARDKAQLCKNSYYHQNEDGWVPALHWITIGKELLPARYLTLQNVLRDENNTSQDSTAPDTQSYSDIEHFDWVFKFDDVKSS